jgi:hypothetical protein
MTNHFCPKKKKKKKKQRKEIQKIKSDTYTATLLGEHDLGFRNEKFSS